MMTKQQEREALERIKNILADAGADSYIGTAFAGCVDDAETNIENDWALSMAGRWQSAEQKLEVLKSNVAQFEALRAERNALRAELDKRNAQYAELMKSSVEALNGQRSEDHTELERAKCRADAAEAEIIRLKAKLYDFMTAQG